jgi:hypothetical protein
LKRPGERRDFSVPKSRGSTIAGHIRFIPAMNGRGTSMIRTTLLPALGLILVTLAASAHAADGHGHGDVTGTFIFGGDPAPPQPHIQIGARVAGCGPAVPEEKILVDPKTKGIANVFIWLPKVNPNDVPADLQKPPQKPVVLDQRGCVFLPHALVARTGQNLQMLNADPAAHNVHTYPLRGAAINTLVNPNNRVGVAAAVGNRPEMLPIPVKCDIHPWMQAYMLVTDNPYAAISDAEGAFKIERLPAGTHEFRVWHEAAGYLERRYRVEVTADQTTDLGPIKIDPKKFKALP